MRKLSFYDHARQRYAETVPIRDQLHVAEIHVGAYTADLDGSVGTGGEFTIALHDLTQGRWEWKGGRPLDPALTPQLLVFNDAYGSLRQLDKMGALERMRRVTLRSGDDLSRLLIACGLRDVSDNPLES